jgi:hypothetical protein
MRLLCLDVERCGYLAQGVATSLPRAYARKRCPAKCFQRIVSCQCSPASISQESGHVKPSTQSITEGESNGLPFRQCQTGRPRARILTDLPYT